MTWNQGRDITIYRYMASWKALRKNGTTGSMTDFIHPSMQMSDDLDIHIKRALADH